MIVVVAALEFANQADRDEAIRLDSQRSAHARGGARPPRLSLCGGSSRPTRMQVHELLENSESLATHFQHPYYDRMAGLLQGVGIVSSTNALTWWSGKSSLIPRKERRKKASSGLTRCTRYAPQQCVKLGSGRNWPKRVASRNE